jgi:ATP-dependent DNA helicase RecG
MTATPIPRTLAMSAYADLDTSVIDELPPGRKPIDTIAIPDSRREEVIDRVRKACEEGRQAYWVCTLIEESEALQAQAAEVTAEELSERLPGLKVGLVHGRLKAAEKAEMMNRFKIGELDLLVATTVIEVGVDVPNASLIIIENPERLGLAQLHQLRGRVGRGEAASFCVLMYHPPLSMNGKARLQALRESQDGFVIAEKDLEIRGPGEVLGTRQTGMMQFRLAEFERDKGWIEPIREMAPALMDNTPLVDGLIRRWLGERIRYGDV